jgi:molecular chaperone DnaK
MGDYLDWRRQNRNKGLSIQLSKLMKVRQIIALEKVKETIQLIEQCLQQDTKIRDLIEERNKLDGLIYAVKKTFSENKNKISDSEKILIEDTLKRSETALTSNDLKDLKKSYDELTKVSHKMTDILYKNTKNTAPDNNKPNTDKHENESKSSIDNDMPKDNIIDADFKEK